VHLPSELKTLIDTAATECGVEYYGHELVNPGAGASVLRIYIDKADGVNIDTCALVAKGIQNQIKMTMPAALDKYRLEVSSPGLNRPLYVLAHYQAQLNKFVKISCKRPIDGTRHFKGTLTEVNDEKVTITTEAGNIDLPWDVISKGQCLYQQPGAPS